VSRALQGPGQTSRLPQLLLALDRTRDVHPDHRTLRRDSSVRVPRLRPTPQFISSVVWISFLQLVVQANDMHLKVPPTTEGHGCICSSRRGTLSYLVAQACPLSIQVAATIGRIPRSPWLSSRYANGVTFATSAAGTPSQSPLQRGNLPPVGTGASAAADAVSSGSARADGTARRQPDDDERPPRLTLQDSFTDDMLKQVWPQDSKYLLARQEARRVTRERQSLVSRRGSNCQDQAPAP
jgi:hypothetical protein